MRWIIVLAVMVVGCVATLPMDDAGITADLATQAAYEIGKLQYPKPPDQECCQKCVNGKVKSGDGLAWVSCPCQDNCKCKGTGKR